MLNVRAAVRTLQWRCYDGSQVWQTQTNTHANTRAKHYMCGSQCCLRSVLASVFMSHAHKHWSWSGSEFRQAQTRFVPTAGLAHNNQLYSNWWMDIDEFRETSNVRNISYNKTQHLCLDVCLNLINSIINSIMSVPMRFVYTLRNTLHVKHRNHNCVLWHWLF